MTIRMFLLQPAVVMAARVNMAGAITYPLDEITFDTITSGAYTAVVAGMTLMLGSAAGLDDYGRQRVRAAATSTAVPVGRSSRGTRDGELDVVDNAYITVLRDFRLWAKMPTIDATGAIFKDSDLGPVGLVVDPPPVSNPGVGVAGTIDAVTSLLTLSFDASESFQFDLSVTGNISPVAGYLWDVGDGTITVGDGTTASITVTFPAGFRYVSLRVTSDGGKTHRAYLPVYARDPANDQCVPMQITSHRLSKRGQEISVRVLADIPRSTYPDGTLAMIWDAEPANPADRSHMQFTGWHQSDEAGVGVQRTGTLRDTTLNLLDVNGKLATLPGFPQVMEYVESPSKWTQTRHPNPLFYICYLLHWHSTALEVADLLASSQLISALEFKTLGSDADNLYNQVNSLANNVTPDHWFTCNHYGQMMVMIDPIVQAVADRTSTIRDTIDESDWIEIRYSYQRAPRVYQLRSYAIDSDTSTITAIGSLAPGDSPGQGEQYIESSERITLSQFDLNNVEGNRYARLNARYGPVTIVVPYERLALANEPAYLGWVRLTVSSGNQPQRTMPFTNQRGLVHEINIAYDYQPTGLVRTATLIWEQETSGAPAVTLTLEAEEA